MASRMQFPLFLVALPLIGVDGFAAEQWLGATVFPASPSTQVQTAKGMAPWSEQLETPSVVAAEKDGELIIQRDGTNYQVSRDNVVQNGDAVEHFAAMVKAMPTSWAHHMLGLAQAEQDDYDKAIGNYTEAIRLDPKSGESYFDRALAWYEKGELDKAIADYSEALRLRPNWAKALHYRSYVWYQKGEIEKAIDDLNKAIQVRSDNADFYLARAACWHALTTYDKAIADYSEVIRLRPDDAECYYIRSRIWETKGQPKEAIDDLSSAIEHGLLDLGIYLKRAELLWAIGEKARSNSELDSLIELEPGDWQLRVTCALAWLRHGDYEKAIAACNEAIRIEAKLYPDPYLARGAAFISTGQNEKAIADFKRAMEIAPHLSSPYAVLAGIACMCEDSRFRDGKSAIENAEKACELTHWRESFDLGMLAAAHAESGDFESAGKYQNRAIDLLKNDPDAEQAAKQRLDVYLQKKPYRQRLPSDIVPVRELQFTDDGYVLESAR